MTQEQIIEGNKLLSEFDTDRFKSISTTSKLKVYMPSFSGTVYSNEPEKMKYHSSWDWLIPACKKFCTSYDIFPSSDYEGMIMKLDNAVASYEPLKAFEQLVTSIKWYNQNTLQK